MKFLIVIFCLLSFKSYADSISEKIIISHELISNENSTIDFKNYTIAARAGWFSGEYWYTFKVIFNYQVNTNDNSISNTFYSPTLYNMKISNKKNEEFIINNGLFVTYDKSSFNVPYGNYNFLSKKIEDNFSFRINIKDSNFIYSIDNKKLNFNLYPRESFLKELQNCQKNYIDDDSKKILNHYEICKLVYSKVTNYLKDKGNNFIKNLYNNEISSVKNKNFQKLNFDNASYLGEVKDGLPHGVGKAEYKNGNIYEGNFQNGQRTGQGKLMLISRDGTKTYDIIEGEFLNGKIVKGKATFVRGDRMLYYGIEYEGEFKNDVPHGKGKKTYVKDLHAVTGKYYEGEFKEGKEHGNGLLTVVNGDIYKVKFNDGKLIDKVIYKKNPNTLQ